MPIYSWTDKDDTDFTMDVLRSIAGYEEIPSRDEYELECKQRGVTPKEIVEWIRHIAQTNFELKGTGWYATDYKGRRH